MTGRPAVAVVLLASGDAGRLETAMRALEGPCHDYGARLVIVWPGTEAPATVRADATTVVAPPDSTVDQRRTLATQQCWTDIMIFTDEARAVRDGWSEALAERLGLARHWEASTHRDWHAILSALGVDGASSR